MPCNKYLLQVYDSRNTYGLEPVPDYAVEDSEAAMRYAKDLSAKRGLPVVLINANRFGGFAKFEKGTLVEWSTMPL
jgi:hypothetical protein